METLGIEVVAREVIFNAVLSTGAERLAQALLNLSAQIAIVGTAAFPVTWIIGSLLVGAPLPVSFKKVGQGMLYSALQGSFLMSISSGVFAVISYIASLLLSAM